MAKVSIKNVSNVFKNIKRKDDALKKLQEQMNQVKEAQKEQTNIIVENSTKLILDKTKLGSYLKKIVSNTLDTGDSTEYDAKLELIIDGISKVVSDVSKSSSIKVIEETEEETKIKESKKEYIKEDEQTVETEEEQEEDIENEKQEEIVNKEEIKEEVEQPKKEESTKRSILGW